MSFNPFWKFAVKKPRRAVKMLISLQKLFAFFALFYLLINVVKRRTLFVCFGPPGIFDAHPTT
jgi:hypothetical protein